MPLLDSNAAQKHPRIYAQLQLCCPETPVSALRIERASRFSRTPLVDILWGGQPWTTMDNREALAVQDRIQCRIRLVPAEGFEPPTV
jgi:hypothetical protein